jgi:3-phenylpropionate/trans-cinnamate dioxygenase ferredoxin subunit
MHRASPLKELAPGDAICLDTSPHALKFNLRTGAVDAPPAKLPVRVHEVTVVDGDIMVIESQETPNLPPGLTVDGHV